MGPQRLKRWIVPPKVGARRTRRERDVGAIIDQDGHGESGHQRPRQLQHVRRVAIFPPDLNHCRAALGGGPAHGDGIAPLE